MPEILIIWCQKKQTDVCDVKLNSCVKIELI